jgi:hypothetical protein
MSISYNTSKYQSFTGNGPYTSIKNFVTTGIGKIYVMDISITGVQTYTTGGFDAKCKRLGVKTITFVLVGQNNSNYGVEYVASSDKIKLFSGLNTELTNETSISGLKLQILVIGKSTTR